ncbi:MAG: Cof-type HAD-IIB family hydrolase [Lachnospiraceae bacterium]|nr:Cof-type HAD-IIB family hydrolase [Lachnospiraceae bacterium]
MKLVASDMDGTLLGQDGRISKRNAEAIHALQNQGIRFVVCTGRAYEDAAVPMREQDIACDIICMNGAAVYDASGNQTAKRPLKTEQVRRIIESCKGDWSEVGFDFMTNYGSYTLSSREQFRDCFERGILLPMAGGITFSSISSRFQFVTEAELFAEDVEIFKASVVHENPFILEQIKTRLREDQHLAIAASHHTNLELTERGAQKGIALTKYAQMQGIRAREIMALGDSENDLSMLSLPLGYTIAMENAAEVVKQTARCQTRSNEADGVAYAIETMILSPEAQEQVS